MTASRFGWAKVNTCTQQSRSEAAAHEIQQAPSMAQKQIKLGYSTRGSTKFALAAVRSKHKCGRLESAAGAYRLRWAERGDGVQLDDVRGLPVLQVVVRAHVRVQLGRRQGRQEARVPADAPRRQSEETCSTSRSARN